MYACAEFPCVIGIKLVANNTRIAGYIRDMTGMIKAENEHVSTALKKQEAIERVVDDHSFDAIIASDKAGTILLVNEQAVKDFGYKSRSDLIDKRVCILFHHIDDSPEKLAENEGKQHVETLTRENGTSMQCIIASRRIAGATDCVVTYVRSLETIKGQL